MSIQKAEMSVEQIENGQIVEQVVYPFVEYDHVTMENGMDIMSMIRDDVSTPTVTHNTTSWKVGQGDSDVNESIVDSSVANMTIKGQTYQNILPSPSLRNSMTNGKTMQKLNEGYDSVNTVDGSDKSAILSGQTLVNLVGELASNLNHSSWDEDEDNYILNLPSGNGQPVLSFKTSYDLPADKTYTLFIKMTTYTEGKLHVDFRTTSNTTSSSNQISFGEVGWKKLLFTTTEVSGSIRMFNRNGIDNFYSISKEIILLEGDWTDKDIPPYFEGIQSVKMPVLTTTGKNLFDKSKIKKGYAVSSSNPTTESAYAVRDCMDYIEVESGATYKLSNCTTTAIFGYKNKGDYYGYVSLNGTNAIPHDVKYIRFNIDNSFDYSNAQLEKNTVATSYEPHKSNILTVNEDVELGSVGNVYDTLDLLTGDVISRTGLYTYKGEIEPYFNQSIGGYVVNVMANANVTLASGIISDKFINRTFTNYDTGVYGNNNGAFYFFDKLVTSAQDFKEKYIGTTFRFELKEESIKTVDLSILDQDNQPTTQLNSFANGYIQVSSQGLIPSVDYEVPTSNSYHVDLMKPNTQYTMKNMQGTFTIDNIQYNASTNGTFTSPSVLTNNFMITSVAQSQPMLLEGDVREKDIPYFKGIKSAFEDESKIEVLSIGKNLWTGADNYTNNGANIIIHDENQCVFEHHAVNNGIKVKVSDYEYQTITISYDFEILDGKALNVGGHNRHQTKAYYIDGINVGTSYHNGHVTTYEKNRVYHVDHVVHINLPISEGQNNDREYISIEPNRYSADTPTYCKMRVTNFQITLGNVIQEYEPRKSNSTKIPLLSPLRGLPNGVRDEIILDRVNHKAKIVQRVGEDLTQLETPIITEVNLEGYPYVYKDGHIFLNTEIAPTTEVTYSINQAHQIESSNEDILRHQKEINHLYELIAQYVQVQYEAELINIALQG